MKKIGVEHTGHGITVRVFTSEDEFGPLLKVSATFDGNQVIHGIPDIAIGDTWSRVDMEVYAAIKDVLDNALLYEMSSDTATLVVEALEVER